MNQKEKIHAVWLTSNGYDTILTDGYDFQVTTKILEDFLNTKETEAAKEFSYWEADEHGYSNATEALSAYIDGGHDEVARFQGNKLIITDVKRYEERLYIYKPKIKANRITEDMQQQFAEGFYGGLTLPDWVGSEKFERNDSESSTPWACPWHYPAGKDYIVDTGDLQGSGERYAKEVLPDIIEALTEDVRNIIETFEGEERDEQLKQNAFYPKATLKMYGELLKKEKQKIIRNETKTFDK